MEPEPPYIELDISSKLTNILKSVDSRMLDIYSALEEDFIFLPFTPTNFNNISRVKDKLRNRCKLLCQGMDALSRISALAKYQPPPTSAQEIKVFFGEMMERELSSLENIKLKMEYKKFAESPDSKDICRYILSQFALDYLTEASPLTRVLGGVYNDIQMAVFKIVSDEYGGGDLSKKHSTMFQTTLRSIGMPTNINAYRSNTLDSVYLYLLYVNLVSSLRENFFKFVGFLFVYEANLIAETKQTSMLLESVFGASVSREYFDLHVNIDKDHGKLTFDRILCPLIDEHGYEAAKEIFLGYTETLFLLQCIETDLNFRIERKEYKLAISQICSEPL